MEITVDEFSNDIDRYLELVTSTGMTITVTKEGETFVVLEPPSSHEKSELT
jgi:prevent-host-death family protein